MRPGHPFDQNFKIQPRRAPYARNGLRELPGRPLGGRMEALGEIPEKGVVRQWHSSPLFERQVRPRVHRRLPARRDRDDPRGKFGDLNPLRGEVCKAIFDPALYKNAPEPDGGRRPDRHLVEQLLRGRDAGRGREILRRHGRPQRPGTDLLRPELQAGEGERRPKGARMEGRRHVFARHREDRLLARKSAGRSHRTAEKQYRSADRILQDRRPARVRPL